MLHDIVEAHPLDGHRLMLRFEDGTQGTVGLSRLVDFEGVFAPLKEFAYFELVRVNPDLGTVCWPNGADLDPQVLYSQITGDALPRCSEEASSR